MLQAAFCKFSFQPGHNICGHPYITHTSSRYALSVKCTIYSGHEVSRCSHQSPSPRAVIVDTYTTSANNLTPLYTCNMQRNCTNFKKDRLRYSLANFGVPTSNHILPPYFIKHVKTPLKINHILWPTASCKTTGIRITMTRKSGFYNGNNNVDDRPNHEQWPLSAGSVMSTNSSSRESS